MNKSMIARAGSSSDGIRVLVYKKSKKRKNKKSRGMKEVERAVRRLGMGDEAFTKRYLKRHRRSNSKRRDGWVRDMEVNLIRAANAGRKKMKMRRILGF